MPWSCLNVGFLALFFPSAGFHTSFSDISGQPLQVANGTTLQVRPQEAYEIPECTLNLHAPNTSS